MFSFSLENFWILRYVINIILKENNKLKNTKQIAQNIVIKHSTKAETPDVIF